MPQLLRRAAIAVAVAAALGAPASAHAGYGVQPNGTTTGPKPSFLVYLEPQETSLALVYVATSPQMSSYGTPTNQVGLCSPTTPFGETNKFSCQPSYYSPSYTSSLAPGTYYWWVSFFRTDPGNWGPTLHISGPFQFTVAQPTAPANVYLLNPADGATLSAPITFRMNAPGSVTMHIYVGLSSNRADDGSPLGLTIYSCGGRTTTEGQYSCTDSDTTGLTPGSTYYWWAVIDTGDAAWVYGPRSFAIKDPYSTPAPTGSSGGSSGSGASGSAATHTAAYAPYLPSADQFRGRSVKQARLSKAVYDVTKTLGAPRMLNVACWSDADWPIVSGDSGDGFYSTLGFWNPYMPRWIELSPSVCRATETLLHNRPDYPNRFTSNAVETLMHESLHALGISEEAKAECFGMQLSIVLAIRLGVPYTYADRMAKINLLNYASRPPSYRDTYRCRENGAWDLIPGHDSWPWHSYRANS